MIHNLFSRIAAPRDPEAQDLGGNQVCEVLPGSLRLLDERFREDRPTVVIEGHPRLAEYVDPRTWGCEGQGEPLLTRESRSEDSARHRLSLLDQRRLTSSAYR